MRWLWIIGGSAFAVYLMAFFLPQSNFLVTTAWKFPITAPMILFVALIFLGYKATSSGKG